VLFAFSSICLEGSTFGSTPQPSTVSPPKKASVPAKPSQLKTVSSKTTVSVYANTKPVNASRLGNADKFSKVATTVKPMKGSSSSGATTNGRSNISGKKRPRSLSRSESSESPPPYKRRPASSELDNLGDTIWKMFGRERNNYVGMDVLSDDEDMEADATILEKEEKMSTRIAKKEDILAFEEERRREEEKRRRKKEKEAREKRN